ncbi:DNA repair metallo-beta-lactamase-domain-containing protein [Amylocystis lapponica]|nr:DNA repair metallo-beta-lactamase-domain-containing protein [Amylocystis lapponica]
MAKKRKQTLQSATLHDFFGKSGGTQVKKKLKFKSEAVDAEPAKPTTTIGVSTQEIIVIDSDDDSVEACRTQAGGGVARTTQRTRNAVASSSKLTSDIQSLSHIVVEGDDRHYKPSVSEAREAQRCASPPDAMKSPSTGASPFGQPSVLLRSPSQELSLFGTPTLLLPSNPKSHPTTIAVQEVEMLDAEEQALWATQGEDWGMGDDEMDLVNPETVIEIDYDDEAEIDLTLEDTLSPLEDGKASVHTCPVCKKQMKNLSITHFQSHVNGCLDSTALPGSPKKPPPPPPPLPTPPQAAQTLRPLTSLQPPLHYSSPPGSSIVKNEASGSGGSDLFSVMMSSHKENEAWKEASAAEDRNFRPTKGNGGRRKAPFYKVMQGMPIAVDAFRYGTIPGVTAYFLTHAHSDHYTNLSSNWKNGPIYCSEGTANLIVHMLAVDRKWVHPLPVDLPTLIPDTGGVRVTLIEANHCPGSCLFLFEGPQTVDAGDSAFKSPFVGSSKIFRYLHCGDFRASPQHVLHPAVKGKLLDHVYLDTTYLDPKYCFPPQPQVITACAELARRIVTGQPLQDAGRPKTKQTMDAYITVQDKPNVKQHREPGKVLVVVGTYSIGKERIVKAIAKALQTKVYCDSRKTAILRCQPDPELHALLTNDPYGAGIHLVPLGVISSDRLKEYVERWKGHFSKVVGFRPTGWTFSAPAGSDTLPPIATVIARSQSRTFTHAQLTPMRNSSATLQVYGVPYSEHSSFFELTCFALSFDWTKMIATVNIGSEGSRKKMAKWFERWEAERKRRGPTQVVGRRADDYW